MTVSQGACNLQGACARSIAEVNFKELQGIPLTGAEVVSVIDDLCIELRCSRDEMPTSLRFLYEQATIKPMALFGKAVVIDELNRAA